MRRFRAWLWRVAELFRRDRRERELADEIESHLRLHTDDYVSRGMSPEAARRAAVLQLGNPESMKERYRDQRGLPLLDHLMQDVRYAGRVLRRTPGVTALALVTVAVGVAGPTVMFSMAKAWILDPLPFAEPDTLLDVRNLDSVSGGAGSINPADFLDWQRGAQSIEHLSAYRQGQFRLTGGDRAERVRGVETTPGFFRLLGVSAAMGRVLDVTDGTAGAPKVVVISHAMWREYFAADPAIVGRTLRLDGNDHVVVGVLPEAFQFTLVGRASVWKVLTFTPEQSINRRPRSVIGLGRLRQGSTVEQARSELLRIAEELSKRYPETNARRSVRVLRLADEIRRHHDLGFLIPVLFAMVGCVLLVACVNVTNVMLARASTRRQEMAVRLALGASRGRIVRQWLVEHVLLFVVASAIGAGLAVYGTAWITQSIPADNRQYLRNYAVLSVDRMVLFFALAVGVGCGVMFGWLPAWLGVQSDVNNDLRDGAARATTSRSGTRVRTALVVCEVALALALLISSGLLVASARNVSRVDVGFEPRHLLTFHLALDPVRYGSDAAIRGFYDQLTADLASRPGVTATAAGSLVPFGTEGRGAELFIDGEPETVPAETPFTSMSQVTPGYETTLRLQLRRGRLLSAADGADAPKVVLINETLSARHFAGRDPLGQRLRLGRQSADLWTVVGIVGDVKNYETVDAPEPQVYVPSAQRPSRQMTVVVRSSGDPMLLAGTIRNSVAALDPAEPISELFTMENLIRRVTGPYQTTSTFVTFFGAVTLLLAGVGVYGVISYSFALRTREIGIRMALGATRAAVAVLVLKQARTFMIAGVLPGLVLAWVLGQALEAFLVGVTPTDWRLYAGMTLVLTMVALLAALAPARRVTTIDPMTALRCE
jgi:putative ABC transport system permease protein